MENIKMEARNNMNHSLDFILNRYILFLEKLNQEIMIYIYKLNIQDIIISDLSQLNLS